jgi:hypothetical protein
MESMEHYQGSEEPARFILTIFMAVLIGSASMSDDRSVGIWTFSEE